MQNNYNDSANKESKVVYHERIKKELLLPDFENGDPSSTFYRKKIVITGVFDKFSRNELAAILKSKGADINSAVSRKTDYLIAGHECGPSKWEKAQTLGLKIINEQEFIDLLKE
jgi:DNA polymerase-3 subunit epsilon